MTNRAQAIPINLPVRVWGMDVHGNFFEVWSRTADITPAGARLVGVPIPLRRGAIIGVDGGGGRAGFRVAWVGDAGTSGEGQVRIQCIEPSKHVWGLPLNRPMEAS